MELNYDGKKFVFEKELNSLDEFVIRFTNYFNEINIRYVVVSGYVAILFGRNRTSEDVDIIIEKLQKNNFKKLWEKIFGKFDCINATDATDAYEYLIDGIAIRFADKDKFIPTIEMKFPKLSIDEWTLNERKEVILNNHALFISPLELQIPFKLYLGSEKDIEDARYLYRLFRDHIDKDLLLEFNQKLNTVELFNKYLL